VKSGDFGHFSQFCDFRHLMVFFHSQKSSIGYYILMEMYFLQHGFFKLREIGAIIGHYFQSVIIVL